MLHANPSGSATVDTFRSTHLFRFNPRHDLLVVLLWALCLRVVFAILTANTYDPDEFVVLSLSRDIAHGSVPYHDFMFFHPPGILMFFGMLQPLVHWWWPSARVITMCIDTMTAAGVWRIGVLLYGRREAMAAGLLYGASPLALICAVRVGQDPIITALGVAGLLLLLTIPNWRGSVLAGICLGFAVWIKYPAVLFFPVYVLAAPRRTLTLIPASGAALALIFSPLLGDWHAVYSQTIAWQLAGRQPSPWPQRLAATAAFWLLLNPLTLPALRRGRRPLWLFCGFALGGVFLFASQTYYHYFLLAVPFAALLAAPLAVRILHLAPRMIATAVVTLSVLWAIDINEGPAPGRLFISAPHLSSVTLTARLLDRSTHPGQSVLTDQFEYAFLAGRRPLANYFWNMRTQVNALQLEQRLPEAQAVVLTERVSPTYPSGFTAYLDHHAYRRLHTGLTEIWLLSPGRAAMSERPDADEVAIGDNKPSRPRTVHHS